MKAFIGFCFLYFISVHVQIVHNWGDIGHKITASIAESLLKEHTLTKIREILNAYTGYDNKTFRSIVDISVYPDHIRLLAPWASPYHTGFMRNNETKFNKKTQCKAPKYCIVKALTNYTNILMDNSITDAARLGEALTFVVHFMGDIFQPLHAGNIEDHGGNNVKVNFTTEWDIDRVTDDLHWLWDNLMLIHWMRTELKSDRIHDTVKSFLSFLKENKELVNENLEKQVDFVNIIENTRINALKVIDSLKYYNLSSLSIDYYHQNWPLVKECILQSGIQMSTLLNKIFDERAF